MTEAASTQLSALWEVYCVAKRRKDSPGADQFDRIEYDIALEEFAGELKKHFAGAMAEAIYDRYMARVRH